MFNNNGKINFALALAVTLAARLLWTGFTEAAESEEMQMGGSSAHAIVTAQAGNDSGAFLSGSQTSQYSRVGRLAVQLVRNGVTKEVPFDWVFHTNDEFRFKITTNRDGWLYILHRSPGGNPQLLYPSTDPNTGQVIGNSRVEKNKNYLVPQPTEGSFVFETDTGAETFFLVIKDRPEPPALNDIMVSNDQYPLQQQNVPASQDPSKYQAPATAPYNQYPPQQQNVPASQDPSKYQAPATAPYNQYPPQQQNVPASQDPSKYQAPAAAPYDQYPSQQQNVPGPPVQQRLQEVAQDSLNYSIIPRGAKKMTALKYRGVSFKPASQGTDPGTYFAPRPDSELQDAWFAFKLNHVD